MKLLLIAYTFPPIPYGGTYRALRLCRGFAKQNITTHVITLKEYDDIPNDYDLLKKVPESIYIHRVPIIDPWRRYQRIKNKYIDRCWFKPINKFISFGLRFITFPDHMLFWVPFAVIKAKKVIQQEDIDTVLVSSPPDSSQLVGLILKKWLKVKWIADFRDPIYGNVAQVNIIEPSSFLDKLHKKLLLRYDRLVSTAADAIMANTETHFKQLQDKYHCVNIHVIRNSYDPSDFEDVKKGKYPSFTIAHVGSIYGKRNPELLFAAVKRLASECAPERLRLQLIFLGLGTNTLKDKIQHYNIEQYVKVLGQQSHKQAIETMCRSHMLLLIKATGKWSKGQIPGKFFEYIGSKNPVICIGPTDSEVAEIIQDNSLGYVVEDDAEKMFSTLKDAYSRYLKSGIVNQLTDDQVKPFSSEVMVEKMLHVLQSV